MSKRVSLILFFGLFAPVAAFAAAPPTLMDYQGVLRSPSANAPLTGSYDMVFHFWDAQTAGNEILFDQHLAVNSQAVSVSGGLFSVQLGSGQVFDGAGPGTYASLADVFRDYATVHLEVQINSERLSPRVRIVSAAYALNAMHLRGKTADSFLDTSPTPQAKAGELIVGATTGLPAGAYGIQAYGPAGGAYCKELYGSGQAYVGYGDTGIEASGNSVGGLFSDSDNFSYAYAAHGDRGIEGYGKSAGGLFMDSDNSGYANVGIGDYGIEGYGNDAGGYFKDANGSGTAIVGSGDLGIEGYGNTMGGYFKNFISSGYAYVGFGERGIQASGNFAGGFLFDRDSSGSAYVGYGDRGIEAYGNNEGGYFQDLNSSGQAFVASGDRGIWGKGLFAGGTFSHPDNATFWADVGRPTYKIFGTGTVAFVQNHPYDKDNVVVYAAPEGDEVAVYTRGTARLVNGESRVKLGETFALVANPDVGLTAQVTPIGDPVPLSVVDKSTSELRVRGPAGSSAEFDYLVYGLRIGFERHAPVQMKEREAFLPETVAFDQQVAGHPELGSLTAFSRFSAAHAGGGAKVDLTRSGELAAAIDDNRDTIIAAAREAAEVEKLAHVSEGSRPIEPLRMPPEPPRIAPEPPRMTPAAGQAPPAAAPSDSSHSGAPGPGGSAALPSAQVPSQATAGQRANYELLSASGRIESGDVLVLDPLHDGAVTASVKPGDPLVVGCAAVLDEELVVPDGKAALAASRIALCRADASFGAIAVGDWLATSPTPGHAMRAGDTASGAILGKAAEPLESGTGLIHVVVTLR